VTQKVFACTGKISSFKAPPFQFTFYDEIMKSLNKEGQLESKIVDSYNDPKIKLAGEYSSIGRAYGYEGARENLYDDSKPRSSLGLTISFPLDGRKSDTQKASALLAKKRYSFKARNHLLKMKAFHSQTISLIKTLHKVIKSQKETNKYLGQSLRHSRKKYNQGRISLQQLISERDSFLQSKLDEINSNLAVVNALLEYLSIYTEIPCEFNRIKL